MLFFLPLGTYVEVVVDVGQDSVIISQCALKTAYPANMLPLGENVTKGDRKLVLKVSYGQVELAILVKQDIGIGRCVLRTDYLSEDIPKNTELAIEIDLIDENNERVAEDETVLTYK